jgi:alkylation response protein AidB-like acyl-CoA dehydrogenase
MNGKKRYGKLWKYGSVQEKLGLLCIDIPETAGGGLDFTFNALLIEEFTKRGLAGPWFFPLHSDIIAPYLLLRN